MMRITIRPIDHATSEADLEARVFQACFGNSARQLRDLYQPYSKHSLFLGCWTEAGRLAAAMRITMGSGGALRTLDDLQGSPWLLDPRVVLAGAAIDPGSTCDIATICVEPWAARSRGGIAIDCLCLGLFVLSARSAVRTWTAMLDDRVLSLLRMSGIDFELLPGAWSAPYLGSPATSPVYADVDRVVATMARDHAQRFATMTRLHVSGMESTDSIRGTGWPLAA